MFPHFTVPEISCGCGEPLIVRPLRGPLLEHLEPTPDPRPMNLPFILYCRACMIYGDASFDVVACYNALHCRCEVPCTPFNFH